MYIKQFYEFINESIDNDIINSFKNGFNKKENYLFTAKAFELVKQHSYKIYLDGKKYLNFIEENKDFEIKVKNKYNNFYNIIIDLYLYKLSSSFVNVFKEKYYNNKLFTDMFTKCNKTLYRGVFINKKENLNNYYEIKKIESFSSDLNSVIFFVNDTDSIDLNKYNIYIIKTNNIQKCLDISGIKIYEEEKEYLCLNQKLKINNKEIKKIDNKDYIFLDCFK